MSSENHVPSPPTRARRRGRALALVAALAAGAVALALACDDGGPTAPAEEALDPALVSQGKAILRHDTFGDETFWTDTLRMHEVIRSAVSPAVALRVGLKVDVDTLPAQLRADIQAGRVDLTKPATTVALLQLGAVVGVVGQVDAGGNLTRVGITCALCHSTVDNSFAPGIGHRLDGWPNRDLDVGAIVALSPALTAAQKAVYGSWGPGKYDARFNLDGRNMPVVIPPAFGLRGVRREIYTGDDTVSYWNAYVAVTQMHGHGRFVDPRIGVSVSNPPELVAPELAALRAYQLSLAKPAPVAGAFDAAAAGRGRLVFEGAGQCATCHVGATLTDAAEGKLHSAAEVGQDPAYAARSASKAYRTTPLRGLWHPPQLTGPYFHDGHAATLDAVVDHYDARRNLRLSAQQKADLVQYLRTL